MRYVAAYLLAALGGKADPSAADVEKILSSVGIDADKEKVQKVVSELKGKKLEEVIAEGTKKLASVPSGGGASSGGSGAAAAASGGAAAEETKKEEKKKEESEESDDDMGFGLFD